MSTLQQIWTEEVASITAHVSLPKWTNDTFSGFQLDSRKVQIGDIFIALQGVNNDLEKTQHYINGALEKGVIGVLTEVQVPAHEKVLYLPQLRQILGLLQQQLLQSKAPLELAEVVAVTGTNGKTTVSRLIAELLTMLGQATAVMGTTGNGILPNLQASTHTTLDALHLQQSFYDYSLQGARYLALEASSHGLEQGRLAGMPISVAAFTNLSRDHLDYHKTLENYAEAKAILFDFPSLKHAVIHQDDDFTALMIEHAKNNPAKPSIVTYSMRHDNADYHLSDVQFSLDGASFTLRCNSGEYQVNSPLLGRFNVENVLAAIICVEKLGHALADVVPLVENLKGAPGRMQVIADQGRLFIVDYAHTPDALAQVLQSLKAHVEHQLWAVYGCGGDRDRGKRPEMTQAVIDCADQVLMTTDNPRTEDPLQIFADMKANLSEQVLGAEHFHEIHDRREAIKFAVGHAKQGDIVVIAGKGHENYQEIDGVRHWFDDVVEVESAINAQSHQHHGYPAE
ncbi:UDP-N-acetylmuramoyl-L-alanyl-D-glutamate--2,6-diaminopimelate ligase [Acinetobacter sp. A3.8]|uniref:UDP-N-acetylmuramoyl-L-alanyl-D-glutamate--2,6-diaminopimelate ligase n=1 Tax=Acinetobacter sedimenti TaxID=2919922 RepID=A0A9X2B5D5_9GAMM|nr:UDP-N-acetylmuramoyl-L-alanyl-D-glutamate--2,6-diaminopimelate ligase [Acinetobacter sedimenti]MCJ8145418.1 UDP-N-acetylmuramoyl-L-alanyl-D-glutamate--2,6-diaminopimelate ligase [Acinetobacter sedimenti]